MKLCIQCHAGTKEASSQPSPWKAGKVAFQLDLEGQRRFVTARRDNRHGRQRKLHVQKVQENKTRMHGRFGVKQTEERKDRGVQRGEKGAGWGEASLAVE